MSHLTPPTPAVYASERDALEERHMIKRFLESFGQIDPNATAIENAECIIYKIDTTPIECMRRLPKLREIVLMYATALRRFIVRGESILATRQEIYTRAFEEAIRLNEFDKRLTQLDIYQGDVHEIQYTLECAAKTIEYVERI